MTEIRPYFEEINTLYEQLLGRPVDHSGYFTYASLLERGELTVEQLEAILRSSPEYEAHSAIARS